MPSFELCFFFCTLNKKSYSKKMQGLNKWLFNLIVLTLHWTSVELDLIHCTCDWMIKHWLYSVWEFWYIKIDFETFSLENNATFLTPKTYIRCNRHMPFSHPIQKSPCYFFQLLAVVFLKASPLMSLPVCSAREHQPKAGKKTLALGISGTSKP